MCCSTSLLDSKIWGFPLRPVYLDERPLGEFLVDLGFVHDVLGSAGVLQRAQSLLHRQ